jgi:hypothetical protein
VANHLKAAGHFGMGAAVHSAATNAFIHGFSVGCLVAGGVAGAGAMMAVAFLPAQPPSQIAPMVEFQVAEAAANTVFAITLTHGSELHHATTKLISPANFQEET